MTVIERLRAALPGSDEPDDPGRAGTCDGDDERLASVWPRGLAVGVVTGLASLALVLAPVLIAWLVEPLATGTAWDAVGTGAALWLLTSGAQLVAGSAVISVAPLLGLALLVVLARYGVREAMVDVSTDGDHWHGLLPAPLTASLGAWWGGYAGVVGLAVALAATGPFDVTPVTVLVPAALVPLAAIVIALRPVVLEDPDVLGRRAGLPWVPDAVRRGIRPGLAGVAMLLGVGAVVVLVLVALAWARVSTVFGAIGAGGLGGALLVLAQVLSLPNMALWVVSFVAGPGFQVVEGGAVTWSGAESGLLPMVPVLAAIPQPGAFPWFTALSSLVVVVVGGLVARRALSAVARLSRLRTKLAVAASACASTAVAIGVLDALAGGSVGQFRLSSVGAPAGWLVLALLGELLVGAVFVVLRDAWRLRR